MDPISPRLGLLLVRASRSHRPIRPSNLFGRGGACVSQPGSRIADFNKLGNEALVTSRTVERFRKWHMSSKLRASRCCGRWSEAFY